MEDTTNKPVASEEAPATVEDTTNKPVASEEAPATIATRDKEYVIRVAQKQARLVGEERAAAESVPADQRAEFIAALAQAAEAALAGLDADQLATLEAAGREGRLGDCRTLLGLN
jgi:hypothetical protein